MNIYYLKKFRKEAHKLFGISWWEDSLGDGVWNVGKRRDLAPCVTSTINKTLYFNDGGIIMKMYSNKYFENVYAFPFGLDTNYKRLPLRIRFALWLFGFKKIKNESE